ncbi:MAG TPA: M48 family metalloprotease [Thermoanaerobaculia bacterium]|nr:M48 family metalloprotease [Thermoanaerobaculia bacterium]
MYTRIIAVLLIATAGAAQAQFGDILKKLDPNKIKKGAEVAKAMSRDFTEGEEADIGRVVSARVLSTYPIAKDDKLQQYVTLVGNTVAAYSTRPTLEWHFAVIDTPIVNAFSAPGGFIFITTGALAQMHSEAELAAVLGHEIGHVTQKHILKEIKRANVINASVSLAQETSSGAQWLNDDYASKIGKIAYEKLFTTGLSRADEAEADRIGFQLADAAGYRASEFITFLQSLEKLEGTSAMKTLTATHPSPKDRIATIKPMVRDANRGELLADRWKEWTVNLSRLST